MNRTLFRPTKDLSLVRRFTLLSVLIVVTVALPTVALMQRLWAEQSFVRGEVEGTTPALALLQATTEVQAHRLHSLLRLSGQADAEGLRAEAQERAAKLLADLHTTLPAGVGLDQRLQKIESDLTQLGAEVAGEKLAARESFDRHGELLRKLDDLSSHVLAASGLLLDPEANNYFLIIAGFQEGKTVLDQLAQLHDLGYAVLKQKGATALDLNQLAAVKARLEDRARFFAQNLELARERAGLALPVELAERVASAQERVAGAIQLTETTFLGMSPDWDLKPADFSARMKQAAQAQQGLTDALSQHVAGSLRERARSLAFTALGIAVVLGLLLAFMAWRLRLVIAAILRPMSQLGSRADAMAEGDLSEVMNSTSRNELGQLTDSLERMRTRWNELLRDVQRTALEVNAASREISDDNLELSKRTETAAGRLQETAGLVNELSNDVRLTSEGTGRANALAREAAKVAELGGTSVGEVVQTMDAIQQSSHRITDIIGVIDGIAFQTNILALNAAVEAARAGDAGRGFAVVAAEVRTLAGRSAEAAKEIKSLISASAERVESGTAIVHQAGATMQRIVDAVQRVSMVINEISAAAERQGHEIAKVDQALREVDGVTQQNAAMVEQSAAAAETLSQQATHLSELVARFRLSR